jgi:hypothetical protein
MTWSSRLEQRWQRRWDVSAGAPARGRPGPYRMQVTSTVVVEGHSPDDVWIFMRRPENAALMQEEITRAYSVPGTGPGVGEMLVYETERDGVGIAHVLTVVEETFAQSFSATGEVGLPDGRKMPVGQTWAVQAHGVGTRAATTAWFDLPSTPSGPDERSAVATWQVHVDAAMRELKRILEAPQQ